PVARMSSTAPPDELDSRHHARAAWLATTSLPRRSTSPPRHRLLRPTPHVTAQRRRAPAPALPALGGHPRAGRRPSTRAAPRRTSRGHRLTHLNALRVARS